MTEQNTPQGQAPQEPAAQQPLVPQQPQVPEAPAPQVPQQAFGDAPVPPVAAPGDASFGAAPAYPPPPTAGEAFGSAPTAEPVKKKGKLAKILGAVAVVILAICIAGVAFVLKGGLSTDHTKDAKVGNCIGNLPEVAEGQDKEANGAKVVECTSADAKYKVEGRLEGKTEAEASDATVCEPFPNSAFVFRAESTGGKFYVLCLSEAK